MDEGLPKLIGFSKKKTKGIHNSVVINLDFAIDSVRSCLLWLQTLIPVLF